jgi:hypothetical protein
MFKPKYQPFTKHFDAIFSPTNNIDDPGLYKREYFASLAMQALISVAKESDTPEMIAKASVVIADALINELNKKADW